MNKYLSYILYLLISILIVILYVNDFGPIASLQRSVDDLLCELTAPEGTRPNLVMVTIDAQSQDSLGQWPWDYDLVADLAAATASAEPRAIMLDFELPENAAQDSAGFTDILASQLSWIDNAVLAYDIALAPFPSSKTNNPRDLFKNALTTENPLGILDEDISLPVRKTFKPAEKLLAHKPYLGFDYVVPDPDRVVRRQPLLMNYEGYYYPSQSLLAAAVYLGVRPEQITIGDGNVIRMGEQRTIPTDRTGAFFIRYSSGNPFVSYSALDMLEEGFDFAGFTNKLVIITVDDSRFCESFRTPVENEYPEFMVKASVIENILNNNIITPGNDLAILNMLILFILGGICAFTLPRLVMKHRIVVLGASLLVLAGANYFIVSSLGIIPQTVYIALQLILFMIASPVLDMSFITGEVDKKSLAPKTKLPKVPSAKSSKGNQKELVREIPSDSERIATKALPSDPPATLADVPEDYQTLELDEAVLASEEEQEPTASGDTPDQQLAEPSSAAPSDEKAVYSPHADPPATGPEPAEPEKLSDTDRQAASDGIKNLGRYQVTSVVGKGAMGLVYKAIDPAINRPVALKTIRLDFVDDPEEMAELKERLFREAQAAGKLSHPNIVTIYDVGSEGHLQYIAMEFLEGQTLESVFKKKTKFNYRIISQIITQICNALDYAHDKGIVHRDIKPANIMIMKDYRIKVMDYGIARIDSSSMTKTGIAMGTPNYISPEQLRGTAVDRRADLFSLGIVMYEMLLGRRPFKGENITSLIYSILNHEPEKPSNVNPQVPLLFDHIIMKALKKNTAERYQKASEITAALADFVESFSAR